MNKASITPYSSKESHTITKENGSPDTYVMTRDGLTGRPATQLRLDTHGFTGYRRVAGGLKDSCK